MDVMVWDTAVQESSVWQQDADCLFALSNCLANLWMLNQGIQQGWMEATTKRFMYMLLAMFLSSLLFTLFSFLVSNMLSLNAFAEEECVYDLPRHQGSHHCHHHCHKHLQFHLCHSLLAQSWEGLDSCPKIRDVLMKIL